VAVEHCVNVLVSVNDLVVGYGKNVDGSIVVIDVIIDGNVIVISLINVLVVVVDAGSMKAW
jgi:hypothetical protein